MKNSGFTLLEMLLSLVLLLTLTQLILSFYSIIIRTANHSNSIILKEIQAENLRELQRANLLSDIHAQPVAGKFSLFTSASSPSMRAQLDLQTWQYENELFLSKLPNKNSK